MKIKKINENAIIPTRADSGAAGYDLYACIPERMVIRPHERYLIGTGVAMAIPHGYFGGIFARSGLAFKEALRPANCVGVVDESYRGEIKVAITNDSDTYRYIEPGQRIAQLVLIPYIAPELEIVDELDETERNEGGFGSTGKA